MEKLRTRDDVAGARILFVSPEGQNAGLADELSEMGAEMTVVAAYRSVTEDRVTRKLRRTLDRRKVDLVVSRRRHPLPLSLLLRGSRSLEK